MTLSWRSFNAARVVLYAVLTPVAYMAGWLRSVASRRVAFVSLLSVWALVETALSAWRADVPDKENE